MELCETFEVGSYLPSRWRDCCRLPTRRSRGRGYDPWAWRGRCRSRRRTDPFLAVHPVGKLSLSPIDVAHQLARIGVDKKLVGVEAVSALRGGRDSHKAIPASGQARSHARLRLCIGQRDPLDLRLAVIGKQAELHSFGMSAEQCELHAFAVEMSAETGVITRCDPGCGMLHVFLPDRVSPVNDTAPLWFQKDGNKSGRSHSHGGTSIAAIMSATRQLWRSALTHRTECYRKCFRLGGSIASCSRVGPPQNVCLAGRARLATSARAAISTRSHDLDGNWSHLELEKQIRVGTAKAARSSCGDAKRQPLFRALCPADRIRQA
jgi:hypothetical protein